MSLMQIFAMLLQLHVCGAQDFQHPDGSKLRIVTCPMNIPADAAADHGPQ